MTKVTAAECGSQPLIVKNWQRLCAKYEENIGNGRAYIELQDLNLTKNALDKLVAEFGSPDVVVSDTFPALSTAYALK